MLLIGGKMTNEDNPTKRIFPEYPDLEARAEKFSRATGLNGNLFFLPAMSSFRQAYDKAISGNDEEKVLARQNLTELLLPDNTPNRSRYFFDDIRKLPELKHVVEADYKKELGKVHERYGDQLIDKSLERLAEAAARIYSKIDEETKGKSDEERAEVTRIREAGLVAALIEYTKAIDPENADIKAISEAGEYLEGKRQEPPSAFSDSLPKALDEITKDAGPLTKVIRYQLQRDLSENPSRENLKEYVRIYAEGLSRKFADKYRKNGKIRISEFKKFVKEMLERNPEGYERLVTTR